MPEVPEARNDFAALMDQISAAENGGDFAGALALCMEALVLQPEHINLRCHAGYLLAEEGRFAEAEKLLREGLERQPESVSLSRNLAETLGAQGRFGEAIALARDLIWPLRNDGAFRTAYAAWLARAGEDNGVIDHLETDPGGDAARPHLERLAKLWNELDQTEKAIEAERLLALKTGTVPGAAPVPPDAAYVRALFDCYAEGFDEHLGALGYCGPDILRAAVDRAMPGRADLDIVDLGCGTGLSGMVLKPLARHLTGVDLSRRMLVRARRRGIYDRLAEGDMLDVLRELPPPYDLITAADVLIYAGDLAELFAEAARVLRLHGCFAAMVEKSPDDAADFILQKTRRYAHSENYIRRLAAAAKLDVLLMEPFVMRREGKGEIPALAFVLGKGADQRESLPGEKPLEEPPTLAGL